MSKSLTATLKYALVSDKKMTLIAKLVQGKKVDDALKVLAFLPKKAAKTLYKVIKSAYSNAKNAWEAKDFYIKEIKVWAGPKIKRIRFTSRSRISHYERSRCFVQVILNERAVAKISKKIDTSTEIAKPVKKTVKPKKEAAKS